jgi:hypothetical protein
MVKWRGGKGEDDAAVAVWRDGAGFRGEVRLEWLREKADWGGRSVFFCREREGSFNRVGGGG